MPGNHCHDTWLARMTFGLVFIFQIPFPVALDMFLVGGIELPQSVTPLFGNPGGYGFVERPSEKGDVAAKNEAREMIAKSQVEEEVLVFLGEKRL